MDSIHRNLTQQMVHELGKQIMQGKYQVADKLPSEADLSAQFAISRTATREAVKMLTAKGLITSRPRQGIRVADSKFWNLFDIDVLQWILLGKPDLYLLRHFLQLRFAIEPEAAFLAAKYAQPEDLVAIEKALAKMKGASSSIEDTHEADIEFHQSVLVASTNPFFIQLKHFIATALKVNLRFTERAQGVTEEEYQAHVDIYEFIKQKAPEKAFDAAKITQRATMQIVNEQIEKLELEKEKA